MLKIVTKLLEHLYLKSENNLVYFDATTTCKSRYYYDTVIKRKYQPKECYVIYFDIDNLKKINDTQGHSCGTCLIKEVGQQLLELKNALEICRIGGDEFLIIADKNFSLTCLKDLKHVSYGYYYKEIFEDISSAVKKADEKMYAMKQTKKRQES